LFLARLSVAVHPTEEGAGCNAGDNVPDLAAQLLAQREQCLSLRWGKLDSLGQLAAEDTVLGFEIFDRACQFLVGSGGQEEEESLESCPHAVAPGKSLVCWGRTTFLHTATNQWKTSEKPRPSLWLMRARCYGLRLLDGRTGERLWGMRTERRMLAITLGSPT
jgi:hypothetical protein